MAAIRDYALDPAAFQTELVIPSAAGPRRFGDVMADFQQERFAALNPSLLAVAAGQTPPVARHWWECVKGSSKTSDLAVAILWLLAFARRPLLIQIGAADADQAAELRRAADGILWCNDWLAEAVNAQTNRIVCQRTGGEAAILASDTAGSHGARPDVVVLDELVHITRTEFAENLLDNLAKMPRGLGIIATNAGFTSSWAWRQRELARASSRWYFHAMNTPAPWLDAAEIEEARRRNSAARFARLWQGVWSSGTGDAIDPDDIRRAVKLAGPMLYPLRGVDYFIGLDLSTKRDHSAAVLVAADAAHQVVRLAQCLSWAPADGGGTVDLIAVRDTVTSLARQFGAPIIYDPHQAGLMVQEFQRSGIHTVEASFSSAANLSLMASTLMQAFRERRLELFDDARLLDDLSKLSIEERGAFGYKLTAAADKESGHADRAFALAIALPAAIEALRFGGIIDLSQQPVVELPCRIMGGGLQPYQGNMPNPFGPPSPSNLPGFGGGLGGSISRF